MSLGSSYDNFENHEWKIKAHIPAYLAIWGPSIEKLEVNYSTLETFIREYETNLSTTFYQGIVSNSLQGGVNKIRFLLRLIMKCTCFEEWLRVIHILHSYDIPCVFNWTVEKCNVYLNSVETLKKNTTWSNYYSMAKHFNINISSIRRIETGLTKATKTKTPKSRFSRSGWKRYSNFAKRRVILDEPSGYYDKSFSFLRKSSLTDLKTYANWCVVHSCASLIDYNYWFENYVKSNSGIVRKPPKARIVLGLLDQHLPYYLSQAFSFVLSHQKTEIKVWWDKALCIAEDVRKLVIEHVDQITWLSTKYKKKYKRIVTNTRVVIGSPDEICSLREKDTFVLTILESKRKYKESQIYSGSDDKSLFVENPSYKATAGYSARQNTIIVSHGMLTRPFFSMEDNTVMYAGIFRVLCHEFCHAIDPSSMVKNGININRLKRKINTLYKTFEPTYELKYNLDENFADLASVHLMSVAFERDNSFGGSRDATKDLFRKFAATTKNVLRPKYMQFYKRENLHALPDVRLDASLSINKQFHKCFNVKRYSRMFQGEWNVFTL